MNSPLQGGAKRRLGWDGPTLAGPRGTRRRLRRQLALVAGVAAGLAIGLSVGAQETTDGPLLGAAGVVSPSGGDQRPDVEKPARTPGAAEHAGGPPPGATIALGRDDTLELDFEEAPAAGLLFDADSGEVLWRHKARDERPVASLAKIMTALLVAEQRLRPGRRVEIDRSTAGPEASGGLLGSAVGLEPGMRVESGALFHAMLLSSANDAASALAAHVSGSVERFVERMNRRARRLSLECTRFVSPHGLEPENRSCAADLAAITRLAIAQPRIRRVAGRTRAVVDFPIPGGERHLSTTNPLLEDGYRGTIGLKTGYTAEAGRCLAAVVERGSRTLAVVLLDSPDPAAQAKRLFDAGFAREGGGNGPQPSPEEAATSRGPGSSRSPR